MSLNESPQPLQTTQGANPVKPSKLIRLPAVEAITALKKSTLYAKVKDKTFPAPVRLSARAVAWREEDVFRWCSERTTTGGSNGNS